MTSRSQLPEDPPQRRHWSEEFDYLTWPEMIIGGLALLFAAVFIIAALVSQKMPSAEKHDGQQPAQQR